MNESLKEEAQQLMRKNGNVKGEALRTQVEYVRSRKGEDGLKKVLEKMEETGYSFEVEKLKYQHWYPEALDALFILTAKKVFNWGDEDIFDMGKFAPRQSFIVKLSAQYLFSIKNLIKVAPMLWKKHYDFGNLRAELNEEGRKINVVVEDYKIHPVMCKFFEGYFVSVFKFCTKSEKIKIEETKCAFKEDSNHEYVLRW